MGCRRAQIRRLSERVHGRALRPLAPGDPEGDRRGARRRDQFRRARIGRGAVRGGDLRPVSVDRVGAVHQFRHRGGQSDGGVGRASDDRARARSSSSTAGITAASSISAARARWAMRRSSSCSAPAGDIAGARALVEPHKGDLAAILIEPMLGGSGCIPATREFLADLRALASEVRCSADLRRGDDLAPRAWRAAGDARHHAGHDDVGENMSAAARTIGAIGGSKAVMDLVRPAPPRRVPAHAGTFRKQQQSDDERRLRRAHRGLYALRRRGRSARLAMRCATRLNQVAASTGSRCNSPGVGSMIRHPR